MSLFLACAKEGLPPGGPADNMPPTIVQTLPEQGAVGVDREVVVQVWFSEGIQPRNASDAVFISPHPGENVKIKWGSKKCFIRFLKPLEANRTIVITFGTGIQDYRNNAMKASYTMAFSTGDVLDEGEISGSVYGVLDASGIDVWAYHLKTDNDPNPSAVEPTYIVQCDKAGHFLFSHISPGKYRLFAVRDRISDRLYQPVEDEIGIPQQDVLLEDSVMVFPGQGLRITREDTTAPGLIRVHAPDREHLEVKFDEAIDFTTFSTPGAVSIFSEEDSLEIIPVRSVFQNINQDETVHIVTEPQRGGRQYRLVLHRITDRNGRLIDAEFNTATFSASPLLDTIGPNILKLIPSSEERNAPLHGFLDFEFDDALDTAAFIDKFSLVDSMGTKVRGIFKWPNPARVVFEPFKPLKSRVRYRADLDGDVVKDLAQNGLNDTVYSFTTLNGDTLSEISGEIRAEEPVSFMQIVVEAKQVEDQNLSYTQVLEDYGTYSLQSILPGRYLVSCFIDTDGDGVYDYGNPFPFQPSEPFAVLEDTVKVRSRWPNEGNDIVLFRH